MKPITPIRKNVETLRARYEELQRLRGYVRRLENSFQDTAEPKEWGARAAMVKQPEDAQRIGSAFVH